MSTKNEMFCGNSSVMMYDINLQYIRYRMHRRAHVRLYVNWPLNTSIPMLTESENNITEKSLISNFVSISFTFIK
jgi:hypothetical protein